MSATNQLVQAGGATPPATVKVWDPLVRVFHWSLATLFLVAYATGDDIEKVHIAAGYTIAGLVAFRVIWGLIGPQHARFSNFLRSPAATFAYLRDVAMLRAPRYIGHNPAGGAMIVALLAVVGATAATGWLLDTDAFWGSESMTEIHSALAWAAAALVALHLCGVAIASRRHRENLVRAMVVGVKRAAGPGDVA